MGGDGKSAANKVANTTSAENIIKDRSELEGRSGVAQALMDYGQGNVDLQEALGSVEGLTGPQQGAMLDSLATSPISGQRMAQDQMLQTKGGQELFGEQGLLDRIGAEERQLADTGFQLTPEDETAYGQISGDIARRSGQQEQAIAQALAQRGLSQAPSGAAQSAFTSNFGNKFEQLAKAQQNIAQNRYQQNMQRLQQNRQMMQSLGGQEQQTLGANFQRNLAGRQQGQSERLAAADTGRKRQMLQQGQANEAFQQKEQTKGPGFGDVLGAVGGGILGAATGGVGTALGAGLGKSVGGLFGGNKK